MKEYLDIVRYVRDYGVPKSCRSGGETLSVFNYNYVIDLAAGFPLLTTKKIKWENIVMENLWFLSCNSNIKFLHKHNIHFWDAWADTDGNLPRAYAEFWRAFPNEGEVFDQWKFIIEEIKRNPTSRRLVLSNWLPPHALTATLPPCHIMSIFNVSNQELNLHLTQRSCDVPVGLPFNIAGYAFILSLVAHLTKMTPRKFAHSIVDTHIYTNQLEGVNTQLSRTPTKLPKLSISEHLTSVEYLDELIRDGTTEDIMSHFKIEGYNPQPFIKLPVLV